jgi:ABC-type multidrug transport system fused ATPase/permease subunit
MNIKISSFNFSLFCMSKRCLFRFRIHPRWLSTTPKPKEFPKSLFSQLTPFIRFSRPEFKIIGGSLALLLISSTVTMSVPFSMGAIIDIVMQRMEEDPGIVQNQVSLPGEPAKNKLLQDLLAKTGSLTGLFGLLGGVFFVGAVANAGRQILMNLALERVITRLRNSLFTNVMRQDIQFYDKNRTGELISRLGTDSVVVGKTLTSNIADGLRGLVMSMSGITAMLYVNVNLTVFKS